MTSHPPDEYAQQARELLQTCGVAFCDVEVAIVATALRARDENAYRRGAEEMREQAKGACEEYAHACYDNHHPEDRAAAAAAKDLARFIAALALPTGPAAPEGEHAAEERGARWMLEAVQAEAPCPMQPDCEAYRGRDLRCPECPGLDLLDPAEVCAERRVRRGGGA